MWWKNEVFDFYDYVQKNSAIAFLAEDFCIVFNGFKIEIKFWVLCYPY